MKKSVKIPNTNDMLVKMMEKKLEKDYPSISGRQRPRNPQERKVLVRWEEKRGGKKIGTI